MGYHNGLDIPNYWSYARHFVLQDHLFESDASWSLPSHLYLLSAWTPRLQILVRPPPSVGVKLRPSLRNAERGIS